MAEKKTPEEVLDRLSRIRPDTVDMVEPCDKYKLAGMMVVLRASLAWRAEELAQNALTALKAEMFVASALSARAVMETTAAMVYLHHLVKRSLDTGLSPERIAKFRRFLINSKVWEDLDNPIHINDMLKQVEELIPGFMKDHYDSLSEWAHPNWAGTFGAFGEFDKEKLLANFRPGGRSPDKQRERLSHILSATLALFVGFYEMFEGLLKPFAAAVKAYHEANPEIPEETA